MKITKSKLRQIIREELNKELHKEGFLDRIKSAFGRGPEKEDDSQFLNPGIKSPDDERRDLTGQDYSGQTLDGEDFTNSDLSGVNFEDSTIINCDFRGAILTDTNFKGCSFKNCKFNQGGYLQPGQIEDIKIYHDKPYRYKLAPRKIRGADGKVKINDAWNNPSADWSNFNNNSLDKDGQAQPKDGLGIYTQRPSKELKQKSIRGTDKKLKKKYERRYWYALTRYRHFENLLFKRYEK